VGCLDKIKQVEIQKSSKIQILRDSI